MYVKLLKCQFKIDDAFGITLLAFVIGKINFFFFFSRIVKVFSCLGGW